MKDKSAVNLLVALLLIAGFALVAVVFWYVFRFGPEPSGSREVWGQFGDYLGGTLNPIFGFLTLIAIVMTLAVQTRQLEISHDQLNLSRAELEATREELRKSAEAQIETSIALRQQARLAALSAKIAAVAAAIEAIDQQLNRMAMSRNSVVAMVDPQGLRSRREQLSEKLQALISEVEAT
jgi:uncharacterized membrane protein